jgi:predicted TPR repeat methyltransferase
MVLDREMRFDSSWGQVHALFGEETTPAKAFAKTGAEETSMSGPEEIVEAELESSGTADVVLRIDEALHFGIQLHRSGHLDDAEKLYRRILEFFPNNLDTLHFLGFLCHGRSRFTEAAELIGRIVTLCPDNAEAHNNLGNTLHPLGKIAEAETCYRKAISLAPGFGLPYNNLAVILVSRGKMPEALEAYRKATELMPNVADFHCNLANALSKSNMADEGIAAYRKALDLDPDNFRAWQGLARVLASEGRREEATEVFAQWASMAPDSEFVQYIKAACLGQEAPVRAPDSFIVETFDRMASNFDKHLTEVLDYRAPELVMETLAGILPPPARTLEILDAGCGTGLCGILLRPYAKSLTGVDLSSGMLAKASARNMYDHLIKSELLEFLDRNAEAFDVIVSADTLCYFGALEHVFTNVFTALGKGGLFAFTLELAADESKGYWLTPNGRYVHSRSYADGALQAAGFLVRTARSVVLRTECGEPVAGQLLVAGKN